MNKHCKPKWIIACVAVILSVLLLFFCIYWFGGSHVAEIQPVYDPALVLPAQEWRDCCINSEGSVYSLSKIGLLKEGSAEDTDIVSPAVYQMLPIGNGVAYTIAESLYYSQGGTRIKVAEEVLTFGQYGSSLVYATEEGLIYLWQEGESNLLVDLEGDFVFALLGNEEYLFIYGHDLYVYQEDIGLWGTEILASSSQVYFLYENNLVLVGKGESGGVVYNLESRELQELNLGFSVNIHTNEISVAADGQWVYLSIQSKIFPPYGEEINTVTLRIDPTDWIAEALNSEYYPSIVCGKDGLYTFDVFKQRGELIYPLP